MKNKIILFLSIIFIFFIFIYPLFLNKFYSFRDTFLYVIPLKYFTIEKIKNGQIPWYNPYNGGGEYFLANPQTNLFYPLSYLFFFPPHIAFQLYQFFQILFCFLGVYLLAKSFGKNEFEGIISGFSVIFSGLFLSLWDLSFEMGCISFLFLTLWALKEKKYKLFILFLSLMFFSGEPFTFIFSFLFIVFFIGIEKLEFLKTLKSTLSFFIFSSGIIFLAISIIPFTIRTEKSTLVFEGLTLKKILSLLSGTSSFYNSNEYSYLPILYIGTFLFSNFLLGLFSRGKKNYYLIPFFFFLFLSMGNSGLFKFLFSFPPLSLLRYPDRFLPLCLVPMVLISFEKKEKKTFVFLFHLLLVLISFLLFKPANLIFLIPPISIILILLIPQKSKLLILIPLLDFLLSFPLFKTQEFKIPELKTEFQESQFFRLCVPEKDILYLKYLYPNNSFTKESDLKGVLSFESYTNLFYPVQTNYTPHPFPLKVYKDLSFQKDFFLYCNFFGIIEKDGLKWQKLQSYPIIQPQPENFEIKADGFKFKLNLEKKEEINLGFINLIYTEIHANGKKINMDKNEKTIKFTLEKGNYEIKISFTPFILKIIYFISFLAWISFLCYLIIRWIISLF